MLRRLFKISLILLIASSAIAQEKKFTGNLNQEIPLDPSVRIGKLENGFTYYIKKNAKPEKKIEFRLAVNAGSILENDDQQGLAHFIEHMAFNGSRNFEKNDLVNYLQSIGVEFGADLNAYTSFDETVYMLPIPTEDPEVVKKGLLVLEDWASGLLFDPEEIDKERGVVTEEWRLGQGADQRMRDQWFPVLFKDSKYANRLPIGTKEIINGASYETIEQFYQDWYRPNLMALVAIGDLDLDAMEKEIKSRFSKLKNPKKPRERTLAEVPDHEETLVSVVNDKEAAFTQVRLFHKHNYESTESLSDLRASLVYSIYSTMLNQRLGELRQSANPPFIFAGVGYGNMLRTKANYSSVAYVGETGIELGLKTLVRENARVQKFGFTKGELERAKISLLNAYEKAFKENDKSESSSFAAEYIRNFLEAEPIPGRKFEFEFAEEMLPTIQLDEVNQLAKKWITEKNRVIVVTAPEKEGLELPTEDQILNWLQEASIEEIEAYDDGTVATELMSVPTTKGSITGETKNETVDITELTLSNGMKVILKSTDFKNDEILMRAFSYGGHSLYEDAEYFTASNAASIVAQAGVSEFSQIDLNKLLAGKIVSVGPYIGELSEGMSGNVAPKDLETLFQLMHLFFTQPRKDETSFQSFKQRNTMLLQNIMSNPQFYFQDQVGRIMTQDHLRGNGFPTAEDFESIDFDRSFEIFQERFADAGDFTVMFVGNFDNETIRPLIETYLASLPGKKSNEEFIDRGVSAPKGKVEEYIKRGTDPKSFVSLNFTGEVKYEKETAYLMNTLADVVSNRLIDVIREEKSGVYGVGANARISRNPRETYTFGITFPCGPENVESLIEATLGEIEKIKEDGVSEEELNEVLEAQKINREEGLKKNSYWIGALNRAYFNNSDLDNFYEYEELMKSVKTSDLKETANKYLNNDNFAKIVLIPEE